eukprot:TRINITY_DN5085_c0_g1_i1.p1 TRINITY_DN5085_c0_g1~~TRINITY_DN5085_c0_g1_i1.p1  ORF type:complete len:284 (-),score=33.36 TRINITY_DN5085_c0_g1_i1:63-914(-)
MIEYLLAAMHPHHQNQPPMPLLSAPTNPAPPLCQPHICIDSLSARSDRTRASLHSSQSLAAMLANSPVLSKALQPFFQPRDTTAYDAISFLCSFGVAGPTVDHWHSLFFASLAAHLRVEDLVVLAACAACGVKQITHTLPSTVSTVIFGADALPAALDKVCDLYDQWLVSEHFFERLLELHISAAAERWSIHVHHAGCTVCVDDKEWNISDELCPTSVTEACAKIMVASIAPDVVQQLSLMVSHGGQDRIHELLHSTLMKSLYAAVVHAKATLYERILSAFGF